MWSCGRVVATPLTIKTVRVIKGNDQPEAELTTFKLEAAELGIDEDGDPITTAILSEQMFEAQARAPKRKLSDRQKLALGALTEVVLARGTQPPPAWQLPNGVQIVGLDAWRDELSRVGLLDPEAPNPRQDFKRIRESLAARKLIGERDGSVWAG